MPMQQVWVSSFVHMSDKCMLIVKCLQQQQPMNPSDCCTELKPSPRQLHAVPAP